ncbi:uncharacterized protein si:dkeyp-55f12.3 [Polypterus senegalus]|uniref:uncharacterized protein si:dkeyp-55f12.3 n=1 Tax=Polypterus senegalus TaxID=55291 RepID=UPI001963F219|nr:uncharacterized protein si:dkeyp-55f12.3 [Polypterus senegalus]
MASQELRGELKHRDGETRAVTLAVSSTLPALLHGVRQLREQVAVVLNELVEHEKSGALQTTSTPQSDDEEEEDDSDEEDGDVKIKKSHSTPPPPKRKRQNPPLNPKSCT